MYFAEYLPRVNSVTVVLDYDGETITKITKVPVNPPILQLVTSQNTYSIRIPVETDGEIELTSVKKVEKTLMMNVKLSGNKRRQDGFMAQQVRWSCKDLVNKTPKINNTNQFSFQCTKCSHVVIDSDTYKFQDMPSEFWYELMDFWHCHKPHNNQANDKNYNGILTPKSDDSVIVGNHYLLFNRNDNVVVGSDIACVCGHVLGDVYQNSCRVMKWNIQLRYEAAGKSVCEQFPTHLFLHNLLLDKINSLAARKFRFQHLDSWWYIWVMNIGLNISINDTIQNNSLKLLYYVDDENNADYEDYEPLDVSSDLLKEFTEKLVHTNALLPTNCNKLVVKSTTYNISYISNDE